MTSENPSQENKAANSAEPKSSDKGEATPNLAPATRTPPVEIPPAPPSYQITCKTEKDWRDKTKFWAELFGLGVLLIYTVFTALMYFANRDAANAAQSAAVTAHDTLVNQQTSFEIDQRPYLVGGIPIFSGPFAANMGLYANLTLKNIGRTPVIKQWTWIVLDKYQSPKATAEAKRMALRKFLADHFSEMRQRERAFRQEVASLPEAEDDLAPQAEMFVSNSSGVVLTTPEFDEIRKPETSVILYLMTLSTYSDVFSHSYETQTCWFYIGSDPKTWHRCQSYNVIR